MVENRLSPIAIVGMGAMFPGRGTTAGYWKDIVEATDTTGEIPETHWSIEDFYDPDPSKPDKTYCRRGAFVPTFPFDPIAFGTPPQVVETTDTVQLLALYVAKEVLEETQRTKFQGVDPERTSIILGVAAGTELIGDMASRLNRPVWIRAMCEGGIAPSEAEAIADRISSHYTPWRESTFPGLLGNVVAGRIANRFNLGGTNFTADAACASSLAAVRHAAQELWLGESDMVLAGGADALNNIFMYMCFSKTPAMSAAGHCRPFSDDADGTLLGEGCGIFALRRLADAERDGNTIYAVIKGIGASSDGRGSSVYAPRADGQARALTRAYVAAGYSPRTVELMEAHGTGTRAGDAAEFAGLSQVYGGADSKTRGWCALGSVKSQIGHTKSAAGAASLIKVTAALHHKVLPPTINVRAPNPKLDIANSPFYLNTTARPWIHDSTHPRRASVSSFGFGGSNFHATLEEYCGPAPRPARFRTTASELFLVSAPSADALARKLGNLVESCRHDDDISHHAHQSQQTFSPGDQVRFSCVAGSLEALATAVEKARPLIASGRAFSAGNSVFAVGSPASGDGRIAFLFAGQGSQYVGMGASLALNFDQARAVWDRAADDASLGAPKLHEVVFPPPTFDAALPAKQTALLTATENAQPAIGLVALSQLALLRDLGLRPDCVAGHSFGEIMALHAAGSIDAQAAIRLARARGLAMARAAEHTPGMMLAVFAKRKVVQDYLALRAPTIVLANDNAPDQVIISGLTRDIEAAEADLSAAGHRVRRLDVATAFHSPLMASAADDLRKAIDFAELLAPQLPVYANATAEPYPAQDEAARRLLAQQLTVTVRFRETIEAMYRDGVRTFIEVGPSSVLKGLITATLGDRPHLMVALDNRGADGVTSLNIALAQLATAGHAIDFNALWADAPAPAPRPVPKPHDLLLNGANYGKPRSSRDRALPVAIDKLAPANQPAAAAPAEPERNQSEQSTTTIIRGSAAIAETQAAEQPALYSQGNDEVPMNAQSAVEIRQLQNALAEEHRKFVEAVTRSHSDFLQASQSLFGHASLDTTVAAGPENLGQPPLGAPVTPLAWECNEIASSATPSPAPGRADIAIPTSEPTSACTATPASAAVADTVRAVVAEKTGYPVDMLELDMDLEAELGIDSIKQVEILSALRERLPDMPQIDPARLAELRTLAQIAEAIAPKTAAATVVAFHPVASAAPVLAGTTTSEPTSARTAMPASAAVADTVRAVVAEKTGYPVDMLELDMDLEAELGIDSIKQVEILSALRERLPDMPQIDPARLAELRTLAQIADAIAPKADQGRLSSRDPIEITAEAGELASALAAALRAYGLQAELRIDPIKQLEILSALRERLPDMPQIELVRLAELRKLAQNGGAIAPKTDRALSGPAPTRRSPLAFVENAATQGLYRQTVELDEAPMVAQKGRLSSRDLIEITAEAGELATALAAALRAHGLQADLVDVPSGQATVVIVTCGLDHALSPLETHGRALNAARTAARAMTDHGGWFVILQDTGGDFGRTANKPEQVMHGGLTGLAKTAAHEWPRAVVRAIDVERGGEAVAITARRIAHEILFGGGNLEVGLKKDGRRLTPIVKSAAYEGGGVELEDGDCIIVSGGARGITASVVGRLAGLARLNLLLLGRSERCTWPNDISPDADVRALRTALAVRARAERRLVPIAVISAEADALLAAREIDQTLAAIRAAGSEATYETVEITDADAVARTVGAFR